MGFGGVKRGGGGRVKFIICGSKCKANRGRPVYMGTDDSHYVILLYSNFIAILTVKDFIGYLFSLNYCCFTCLISIEIGKAKSVC